LNRQFVVAVDVGTGSARAGIFDQNGDLLARAERPIVMHTPRSDHAEHDSEDIWRAVCEAVRQARVDASVEADAVAGIGFDATCSLVVRGKAGEQVSVSTSDEARWDTIVWLDHRAIAEADLATQTGHRAVDHVGGAMSPEMATPKLAWLKKHKPASWNAAGHFFDLTDFLTFKASGSRARSQCTLTCKWTFLAHEEHGWKQDYLEALGIGDMVERGNLPRTATPVGSDLGALTQASAADLGLTTGCRVAVGLIDAHAGAIGVLGGFADRPEEIKRHLALIAGTSSCVSTLSVDPIMIKGFWGPYLGAALPGYWLSEGGQSVTGALLDHVIRIHGGGLKPDRETHQKICARVSEMRREGGPDLAPRLHVLPDFHGNRSPLGDPHAVGVISGLTLDPSFDGLCRLYWRTAVAIALGVRHILETLNANGHALDTLHVTGGHTKNPLLMELYADATGCGVVLPGAEDAVLLGTAMLAATAAGWHGTLAQCCVAMQKHGTIRRPNPAVAAIYDRDYAIFLEMQSQRARLDEML
jgi:FGGY-family pentulose kinase